MSERMDLNIKFRRQEERILTASVIRVPGYRSRGPGLERGPLSLVMIIEELFQGNSGSGLENRN
jgi:hypothetical protein